MDYAVIVTKQEQIEQIKLLSEYRDFSTRPLQHLDIALIYVRQSGVRWRMTWSDVDDHPKNDRNKPAKMVCFNRFIELFNKQCEQKKEVQLDVVF